MNYQEASFFPNWSYTGQGGVSQICRIYARAMTYKELQLFFKPSGYLLGQNNVGYRLNGEILEDKENSSNTLNFTNHKLLSNGGYVKFTENTKDSPQGQYYEIAISIEPDTDSLNKWLQELNSHGRPTLFVIVFSQGGGRLIGSYNGAPVMESKFSGGGRKQGQDRELYYKYNSQHPSFFIETI